MPRYLLALTLCSAALAQKAFDVASFKPVQLSATADYNSERIVAHPGTLSMSNIRVRTCIQWAYGLRAYQLTGPAWLGEANDYHSAPRFEILAKATPETSAADLRLMLRTLLAERLKLVVHRETRELASWVLTVPDGHKLKPPTDPDGGIHLNPSPTGLVVENATVEEFADVISGPLHFPVVDRTGLTGRFNFSLDISRYPVGNENEYYFSRAIREQLGIRLERQKVSLEMLVVDSGQKSPVEF
jgi:uncharacterized protein (TIGR03435 family)